MQDNYTLAQPGIQTKVIKLKDIMKRIDSESCVVGGVNTSHTHYRSTPQSLGEELH